MRPTVCSQKKTSYHHVSPADNKKPPIIQKKQKPTSVYADSIHGSECSNSAISNTNLKDIEDDGTECSLETSEYEIKEVIFLEPEKSHINEVDTDKASKLHMKNNIVTWIQLDMKDQKSLHTVPAEVTNLSSNNEYIPIIIKDVCQENIRVMNINTEKSAECTAYDEDAEEINILLVTSKNSQNFKDLEQIDDASSAVGDTTLVHIADLANSQKEKHERGTVEIIRKSVQMLWNCILLALGIQDIGFDNEFFQGLLL